MIRAFTCILLGVAAASLVLGQDNTKDAASKLVGTWKSLDNENGESLALVTFKREENKVTGTWSFADWSRELKRTSLLSCRSTMQ